MPIPKSFAGRLRLPIVVAPMFLASGPELVVANCRAGTVIAQREDPMRPHAGEAADDRAEHAAKAPADPCTGAMADRSRRQLHQLRRNTEKRAHTRGLSPRGPACASQPGIAGAALCSDQADGCLCRRRLAMN